jgi:hypothetical protein
VNNPRSVNREVFQGSDMIALRLRAAKKPAILSLFELPYEEIEIEPEMIEPVLVNDVEVVSIEPMVVPMDAILPWEDDEEGSAAPPAGQAPAAPPPPPPPVPGKGSGELPLFGVGWIDSKRGRRT